MDCDKKIVAGEDCQFRVKIKHPEFDGATGDFSVVLSWGMEGASLTIGKDEMTEQDGKWLFGFGTGDMFGKLVAECRYEVVDATFEDGKRDLVERHVLGHVVMSPEVGCCKYRGGCLDKAGYVVFERVMDDVVPLPDAVAMEREDRIAGDNANRLLIEDLRIEYDRSTLAVLRKAIDDEIERATGEEERIEDKVDAERGRAMSAEGVLRDTKSDKSATISNIGWNHAGTNTITQYKYFGDNPSVAVKMIEADRVVGDNANNLVTSKAVWDALRGAWSVSGETLVWNWN